MVAQYQQQQQPQQQQPLAPQPLSSSIQQQTVYSGMGRSLPTSDPPSQNSQTAGSSLSLQNPVLNDPRVEFKRRYADVAPHVRRFREQLAQC